MNELCADNHQRILVIDDNPAIHEDFRKIFGTNAGNQQMDAVEAALFGDAPAVKKRRRFTIDSAHQGEEGLALVAKAVEESRPYGMAFVDMRMPPGWDGVETVSKIWETYPDLQIVLCTAFSDYSWEEMRDKLGESDRLVVLKKPFDNIEVLQLAEALTEKWRLLQQTRSHLSEMETTIEGRTEQLRKSEERFRLITENAADLIAIVDTDGNRLYNSPSYQRLLGFTAEELKTTPAFAQVHPEDLENVLAATRETIETGIGQVTEYRMQHKDGSWRTLDSHGAPFRNSAGAIEGLLIVARDITERKVADHERQMMEVQLRQAQKLESIGQLAAGIAHEINTPTQYIGDNTHFVKDAFGDLRGLLDAYARMLEAAEKGAVTPELVAEVLAAAEAADVEYLTKEIPKAIDQSLQGVSRVSKIVGAMKDFSHPGTSEKSPIDLNRAIESTITVATNEWKYVANMVTDFDPALPAVPCLPGEFNQVILNIVVNASHAIADVVGDGGRGKGTITVSTRRDGDWAEIRIRDSGTGISEQVRGKIFDPFFTTKGVGKGTGQGLAIAHSVMVDKHGGSIRVESEMGKGTTFILRLPINPPVSKKGTA